MRRAPSLAALCAVLCCCGLSLAPPRAALAADAPSASVLRGTIQNMQGQPLAGARVRIPALGRGTVAGADGSFEISGVPAGRVVLEVRWQGFAPLIMEVSASSEQPLALTLEPTPFQMPGVTVTANRSPESPLSSPLPVSELSGDQLRREQGVSLAHSLNALPGVRDLHTGQEMGKPVIRGLTGSRVLVLDNSNRMEDYSWSEEDGPSIDALSAGRVEVIRGPASLMYGSDALGGVINAIPRDLPRAEAGQKYTNFGYGLYGASNNKEFGGAFQVQGASGDLGWRLLGIGRTSEALHTPDGELENTGFTAINGEAAVGVHGEHNSGVFRVARYGGEFKLLEANEPAHPEGEEEEGGPERKSNDVRAQFNGNHYLGSWWLETRAQYQTHALEEVADEPVVEPALAAGRRLDPRGLAEAGETTQFNLLLNTFSGEVIAHHALGTNGKGTLGVSGFHQKNDSKGPQFLVPDATTSSFGGFGIAQVDLKKLTLLGGARVDNRTTDADANTQLALADQSQDWTAVSGDIGLVYHVKPSLALSANVGRAWRAPNIFELYTNGPHPGEDRFEIGDANLEEEEGLNADVGVRWEHERFRGELAGFRNAIKNFIFITPTGATQQGFQVYRYEQTDAILLGGEASAEFEAVDHLTLRGRFDYVRGSKDEDGNPPLPLIPPARTTVEVEWHSTEAGGGHHAHLGLEGEFVATQHRLSEFDFATTGYGLMNLDSGLEHNLLGRPFNFDLGVRNLLNKRYKDYLSRYKLFALDPGINVMFRISTGI